MGEGFGVLLFFDEVDVDLVVKVVSDVFVMFFNMLLVEWFKIFEVVIVVYIE